MFRFRLIVATLGVSVLLYTMAILPEHGLAFVPVFVTDLAGLSWRGQFNLDFACYLVLSALWVAWRGGFSRAALGLAAVASVAGILFLAPYLIWLSLHAQGDVKALLLGVHHDTA